MKIYDLLKPIKAEDVMTREFASIASDVKIEHLMREHILKKGWQHIVVVDEGMYVGSLTLTQIKSSLTRSRPGAMVGDFLTRSVKVHVTDYHQPAYSIYEEMQQRGMDFVPVVKDGMVIGVVTMEKLLDLIKIRSRFGA